MGAAVAFVNPSPYEYYFKQAAHVAAPLETFALALAGVLAAAAQETGQALPGPMAQTVGELAVQPEHTAAARALLGKERALILLGQIAQRHPRYSDIRALAGALAALTGARLGYVSEGANAAGAALAGALPHRDVIGSELDHPGLDALGMVSSPRRGYLLFGLEPERDLAGGALADRALLAADSVVCFTSFASPELLACADVLLPIGTFAETPGTFVNAEGRWQSFDAAAELLGDARPGWRVLRVLGNELELPDCEYRTASDVCEALRAELGPVEADAEYRGDFAPDLDAEPVTGDLDVPIYSVDALVRRASALQATVLGAEDESASGPLAANA